MTRPDERVVEAQARRQAMDRQAAERERAREDVEALRAAEVVISWNSAWRIGVAITVCLMIPGLIVGFIVGVAMSAP